MPTTVKPSNAVGPLFFLLFGTPFTLIGAALLYMGVMHFLTWRDTANWVKTPARFGLIEVRSQPGSKGGTLYSLAVGYEYEHLGKTYQGGDVSLESQLKSNRESVDDLAQQIRAGVERDQTFPVLVNPKHPDQAIVFRDDVIDIIALPLIGSIFGSVGLGVMVFGFMSFLGERRRQTTLAADPGRPWRAETLWKGFTVTSQGGMTLVAVWAGAIFMNLFISIFVTLMFTDPSAPLFAKMIICLFALFALALLGFAIYLTLQHFKYGDSTLLLSQMPLVIGQEFSAIIIVSRNLEMPKGCIVSFKCQKTLTTGSGKQARTRTDDLHVETQTISQDLFRPEKGRSAIPVAFEIPPHLPPREAESNPSFKWVLDVAAETPGIDYAATFELPVYLVSDASLIDRRDSGF